MNGAAVKSQNTLTEAQDAVLRALQDKLYAAHGVFSCARAKVELSMEEDDQRFAIEHALDLAMGMLYEVAANTESVAIRQLADAWTQEPETASGGNE